MIVSFGEQNPAFLSQPMTRAADWDFLLEFVLEYPASFCGDGNRTCFIAFAVYYFHRLFASHMLYLFYGSDKKTAREKASALVEALRKKKPDAGIFRIDGENWNETKFQELTAGQGLFNNSYIVRVVSLFENKEAKEVFLGRLEEVAVSPNIFIVLEGDIDKKTLLAITKIAEKVQLFENKEGKKKQEFNIFSLADALAARDKRGLWVEYVKAVRRGASPEELSGILFWKVKDMLASGARGRFSAEELRAAALRLLTLYHDAHRGLTDFETGLERFVLEL